MPRLNGDQTAGYIGAFNPENTTAASHQVFSVLSIRMAFVRTLFIRVEPALVESAILKWRQFPLQAHEPQSTILSAANRRASLCWLGGKRNALL